MEQQSKTENPITLTEKAASKIKYFLEKESKKDYGFRVGIIMGGCSGYMYEIGFEKSPKENDAVIEDKGIKIFINPESTAFMKGSTVDYREALQGAGFKVNNPNVKRSCGCGHSVG
ncbi:MAG TPA: iron-sulfur cluster assembly accessory protein [Candidatus Nanoarchaeia archaeon]|nr:iron-sulfur cluster assembly accessory protein [Candidatus Nanoarchaeia archaeon]